MAVTYTLVVSNHKTGERFSWAGTKAECDKQAEAKVKEWGKRNTEVELVKR